jgi:hypothetical protein
VEAAKMPSISKEDIEERLFERGGEDPLPPAPIRCPHCGEELAAGIALMQHIASAHPRSAPRLLLDGEPLVGERKFHRQLDGYALEFENASDIRVSQDGGSGASWTEQRLRETVATTSQTVLDIVLIKRGAEGAVSPSPTVRLLFEVPDEATLAWADARFADLVSTGPIDQHSLDQYADAVGSIAGATPYASALYDYVDAVLIKDRAVGTGDFIPFAAYRDKLQSALAVLRDFPERPTARTACSLVRFNLNDFQGRSYASGDAEIDDCIAAMRRLIGAPRLELPPGGQDNVAIFPRDIATASILGRWNHPAAAQALAESATQSALAPPDAAKCGVLALALLPKYSPLLRQVALGLANDLTFGDVASAFLESQEAND